MKDSGDPPSIIHLSDRRPTPREQPTFVSEQPPASETPVPDESFALELEPLRSLEIGQSLVLERLIPLALPELGRSPLPPLCDLFRTPGGLSEAELRSLEAKLGTYSRWVRQTPWLRERGHPLAVRMGDHGLERARPGDTGVTQQRGLYLLPGGVLGYVEVVNFWKKQGPGRSASALTPTGARRVSAQDAVKLFPLHQLLSGLRALLWFDREAPLSPPDPDVEARRTRFLALVRELSQATEDYDKRLWRLGLGPG